MFIFQFWLLRIYAKCDFEFIYAFVYSFLIFTKTFLFSSLPICVYLRYYSLFYETEKREDSSKCNFKERLVTWFTSIIMNGFPFAFHFELFIVVFYFSFKFFILHALYNLWVWSIYTLVSYKLYIYIPKIFSSFCLYLGHVYPIFHRQC